MPFLIVDLSAASNVVVAVFVDTPRVRGAIATQKVVDLRGLRADETGVHALAAVDEIAGIEPLAKHDFAADKKRVLGLKVVPDIFDVLARAKVQKRLIDGAIVIDWHIPKRVPQRIEFV